MEFGDRDAGHTYNSMHNPVKTLHVVCPQYLVLEHSFPQIETPSLPIPTMATPNPLSGLACSGRFPSMEWYTMWPFVSCFSHWASCFQGSSMFIFYGWVIVQCVDGPHFVYLGISSWTFRMFPPFGFMLYRFCVGVCFHFSWVIPRRGIAGSCGNSV